MDLIVNGQLQLGWRIDDLSEEKTGMNFLSNPFAVVPKKENADFVVTACNAYEDLVRALKALPDLRRIPAIYGIDDGVIDLIESAIKKSEVS